LRWAAANGGLPGFFWTWPIPFERPRFGGEVQELETVAAYVRAMHDLEKKGRSNPMRSAEEDDTQPKGKGKRGKQTGKKGDKSEEKTES